MLYVTPHSEVKSVSRVRFFATPWTVAYQAPSSMGFSRQEYWSGLPFPSPGDLTLPSEPPGKSQHAQFFLKKCSQSFGPEETLFLLTALSVHPVNDINHELIIHKHVCVCMCLLIFPCSLASLEQNL